MINDDEERRKFHLIPQGNGYLVCDKCGGYYELKNGEIVEHFSDKCECGGTLHYQDSLNPKPLIKPKKRNYIILGVCICLVLVVLFTLIIPGTFAANKTFSKGGISFQYPNSWSDNKTYNFVTSTNQSGLLGTIGDDSISMAVSSVNLSQIPELDTLNMTADELLSVYANYDYKSEYTNINKLSLNTVTVSNRTAYEMIYTSTDPVTNEPCKTVNLLISNNGIIYSILFKTSEEDFKELYPKFKEIESSITFN